MTTVSEAPLEIGLIERQLESALLGDGRIADCAVVFQGAGGSPQPAGRCTRCGMDAAYPGTVLDGDGVCDLCVMYDRHGAEIMSYFGDVDEFARLVRARSAGAPYDCLLLFSGGKDSTYVLHRLIRLDLRVMTFTFDNGFISRTALENVKAITSALGIEHVTMTRAGQNRIFVQSLQQHQSVCNGCFRSLLDLSHELAYERGIPTIVTGLSRGQIIDERLLWFYRNGEFDKERIDRQLDTGRKVYHQVGSALSGDLLDRVAIVDYYRYSDVTKDDIRAFLDSRESLWAAPKDTGFCSSNCMINDVGVYVHEQERGFHNYESPTRWEVRLGHLDRAEADAELRLPIDLRRVRSMLARIGYTDPADRSRLGRRMTAYYVPRVAVSEAEVRAAVAERLPEIMLPEHWIELPAIPRTAGAVDREALPVARATAAPGGTRLATAAPGAAGDGPHRVPQSRVRRFLAEEGGAGSALRSRALLLELAPEIGPAEVRKAVLELLVARPDLRAPLHRDGDRWQRGPAAPVGQVPVARLDLTGKEPARAARLLRLAAEKLAAHLAAGDAPHLWAVLVQPGQLLLIADELTVDGAGWRAVVARIAGAPIPPEPMDAATPPLAGAASDGIALLPEAALGTGTFVRRTSFDENETAAVLAPGPAPAGSVAAAVAGAVAAWRGAPAAVVGLADHTGEFEPAAGWFRYSGGEDKGEPVPAPGPRGTILITHLGDLDALVPPGAVRLAADPAAGFAEPLGRRSQPLEVVSHVRDGRLHLDWIGAADLYAEPAAAAAETLRALGRPPEGR